MLAGISSFAGLTASALDWAGIFNESMLEQDMGERDKAASLS
jgi:hypothetical protein